MNSKVSWAPLAFDILAVLAQLSGALLWPLLQVIIMMLVVVMIVMMLRIMTMMPIKYSGSAAEHLSICGGGTPKTLGNHYRGDHHHDIPLSIAIRCNPLQSYALQLNSSSWKQNERCSWPPVGGS